LAGDDEFVAVWPEVVLEVAAKVGFGGAVGRTVVVREVEVGDAQIEGSTQDGALHVEGLVVPEVVPQAQ